MEIEFDINQAVLLAIYVDGEFPKNLHELDITVVYGSYVASKT